MPDPAGSGELQPLRPDGTKIDATFEVLPLTVVDLLYHHKAGARNSPRAVNQDYHEGLETLLSRLASVEATIVRILVDSSTARRLAPDDRELDLDFPIDLSLDTDVHLLRLDITRAQKSVARRPGVEPVGGNDQKRIRMTVLFDRSPITSEHLSDLLKHGSINEP